MLTVLEKDTRGRGEKVPWYTSSEEDAENAR